MPLAEFYTISIHAPTRGATLAKLHTLQREQFQSTLPHGERRGRLHRIIVAAHHFNPRSHTGSDVKTCKSFKFSLISIHAPTRGATEILERKVQLADISIHAPTRGATRVGAEPSTLTEFQSTLPHGERHTEIPLKFISSDFNPRSHTGSDSNIIQKFRIFSFICDNYKYTLHFYASFCGCIIPHNKKYAAYIWCESHRYFMCACHSHSTCYKTRG